MALDKPVAAFVRFRRSFEAGARKLRRGDAGRTRPARMHALVPRAFFEKFLAAGGGAAREALRHHELPRRQTVEPARLQRAREMRHDSGRMKTVVVEVTA